MKEIAIKKYLQEQVEFKDIVTLHNMFCEKQELTEFLIYSFVDDIDKFFNTPSELMETIHKSVNMGLEFNPNSKYFWYNENDDTITTNIALIDYEKLADYLIDWSDSEIPFDITDYLVEEFCQYAYKILDESYTMSRVHEIADSINADYLMEEWDDIIHEFEGVVEFCPNCGNIIYSYGEREYIYETGKTKYHCNGCGATINI